MLFAPLTGADRRVSHRRTSWAVVTLLVLGLLAACTGDDDKNDTKSGDGGQGGSSDQSSLPVVGSWVVDGGTAEPQDVRVAIHGVRRIEGATVLDWSVTPLAGDGQSAGDDVDQDIDVGITPGLDNADAVRLVDLAAKKVYRPLDNDDQEAAGQPVAGSLGVPWYRVEDDFAVGETKLLQYVFPELPDDLETIAVANQGAPLVAGVPIAPIGKVLSGGPDVDLAAPADTVEPATNEAEFTYPVKSALTDPQQQMSVRVDQVLAADEATSIQLTVTAKQSGSGLDQTGGMPVGDTSLVPPNSMAYENVASGPGLQVDDGVGGTKVLRAWFSTLSQKANRPIASPDGFAWRDCLCSNLTQSGARLAAEGRSLTLWVQAPPLPADADTADVVFPNGSLPAFNDIAVTRVKEPAGFSTRDAGDVGTWTQGTPADAAEDQVDGWSADEWPTPVPDPAEVAGSEAVIDNLEEVVTDEVSAEKEDTEKVEVTLDSTVSFQPDSATLTTAAQKTIRRIAADISESATDGATVLIEGHVAGSDQGSRAFQQKLSQQRADAVKSALAAATSGSVTFKAVGRGAEKPVAPNDTEENRKKNRRVVVTYEH